jgi:glycosyltransferase involved in cell wall biosynthesis
MAEKEPRTAVIEPNILYFGPLGLQGGIGGSARLRNMLDVLGKLAANTRLISYLPERRFKVTSKQINDHLNTTTICVSSSAPKIFRAFALLLVLIYGLRYIRKRDIIFAHSSGMVYGFPALILAKTFGKPLLIDLTDIKDSDTPQFIYSFVLKHSSIVFAVSQYLAEIAREAGCRNVVHAPGFISADVFQHNASERTKIRKKLNIGNNEVVIGYAGAFSSDEGLDVLLRAFTRLSRRYEGIKLVLLGGRNVPGSDSISQLINELTLKERVMLIPPQPYEAMPGYLSALDIACSPKVDSPANRAADPIRVYEYMSVGLPVVASALGETANAIENGHDGFLVKHGDDDDLERMLDYVIQNLDSLQEVRRKAREKVIKNYTQEVILKKLETHLKGLLTKQI